MDNKRSFKQIVNILIVIAILAWCVLNVDTLFGALGKCIHAVSPFLYGCMIAFAINVLLRWVEKKWDKIFGCEDGKLSAKLKRPLSIVICLVIVFGLCFAIMFLVIPGLYTSTMNFIKSIPELSDKLNSTWASIVAFAADHKVILPKQLVNSSVIIEKITDYFSSSGSALVDATINKTTAIAGGFVTALLSMIFAIYILGNKEKLAASTKRSIYALLPDRKGNRILNIARITDETFSNFISGQCLEACCFGCLSAIGLLIFKFPYPGMIGALLGFTTLIPVFGAFIGGAIGFVLIAFTNPIKGLWFILFLCILQQLDNNLIYPRIVGKSVGLPGMLVLLAVTVGGSGFGIIGLLAAVPLCAVFYGLYNEYIAHKIAVKRLDDTHSEHYDAGD